jgi:PST family polysaccharide transporter
VYSWRGTALAMLEARMSYRIVAVSEIVDQVVFYLVAIPLVAAGAGIRGVALALAVRGLPSALILRRFARLPRRTARPTRSDLRELAAYAVPSLRTAGWLLVEGLIPIVMLGGSHVDALAFVMTSSSLLGYATVVQVVAYRVGFPAISRLADQRARLPPAIDRALSATLAVQFASVVPLVGLSPLWLPQLFGSAWHDAPPVMLVMSAGFVCSGAIGVLAGAHYGVGNPRTVATAYAGMTLLYLIGAAGAVHISALLGVAAAYAVSRAVGVAALFRSMRRSGIKVRVLVPSALMLTTVALSAGLVVGLRRSSVALVVPVALAYGVVLVFEVRANWSLLNRTLRPSPS